MKAYKYLLLFFLITACAKPRETELAIATKNVTIQGTLIKVAKSNAPLVIIIPGSGPTDRNGNNAMMKNNSLKYLADALKKNNISSYRYDKSVLSYSKEDKEKINAITFDNFVEEAKTVITHFKKENKKSKIIIAGHSQGSLVGMLAGKKVADAFISIAGAGESIDRVIIEQVAKSSPLLKEETKSILAELKKGNTVEEVNPYLAPLFNKQVQPFLISWVKYNPQEIIKQLAIPILLINGTKDLQVPVNQLEILYEANKKAEKLIVNNMNHILKIIKEDSENMASYNNPNLPISEEMVTKIVSFIATIK